MPFKVHCPYRECRVFMLLEDDVRGTEARCLLCGRPFRVDASGEVHVDRTTPPPVPDPQDDRSGKRGGSSFAGTARSVLGTKESPPAPQPTACCPDCKQPLHLLPSQRGKPIQCPACKRIVMF